jgi:hypothetical protein
MQTNVECQMTNLLVPFHGAWDEGGSLSMRSNRRVRVVSKYSNVGSLSDPSSFSLFPASVGQLLELRH